ncbi:hypothetical protein AURDEDRAFT_68600 [Auricularia subglabra TFB-10046 SS5]|nr:hypothetical protein AURDEDRAFT_68600 [Auricularia subglabra TFB-10046 SS5]
MKLIWANILMPWHNLTEEQRTKMRIIALCVGVWVLWQVPGMGHVMRRSFTHDPLSGRRYTLLTSTISHQDFFHGALNGVAFASFALPVMALLDRDDLARGGPGRVQVTPVYEFAALLVAAGLASGLASHVWSTRVLLPRAVRALGDKAPTLRSASAAQGALETHAIAPSLGISGAIYALVTLVALGSPSAEVSIIFLPFFSFPIAWGFGGFLCLDAVGLIRGWRAFDHAAHLGGAAFGAAWHFWGGAAWQAMRSRFRKDKQERAAQPPVNSFARN